MRRGLSLADAGLIADTLDNVTSPQVTSTRHLPTRHGFALAEADLP